MLSPFIEDVSLLHRGSYISAYVLFNLFNKLGEKVRCDTLPSILMVCPNESNKFNNTGTLMQNSVYHMTSNSHLNRDIQDFAISKRDIVQDVRA